MKLLWIIVFMLAMTSCSTLTIVTPDGTKLEYYSFMSKTDSLKTEGSIPLTFKGSGSLDLQSLLDVMKNSGTLDLQSLLDVMKK